VLAHEIIVREVEADSRPVVFSLLAEGIGQAREPAPFLAPKHTALWLGESGNDPAAARAACKTSEGVRWTMTKEERAASKVKRAKPTISDPGGLF